MSQVRYTSIAKAALLLSAIFVCATAAFAIEPEVPSSVDVYWQSTRAITVLGVTSVIVLDEDIAHAQLGNDVIEFAGLSRGNTVALAYVKGVPVSIVVHVIEHPLKVIPPSLLRREAELGHGTIGSDLQVSDSGGATNYVAVNSWSWAQQLGDNRLSSYTQFEDNTQFGSHAVNLRSGNVSFGTRNLELNVIDFNQSLTGETFDDRANNFSTPDYAQLRGLDVTLRQQKNQYSIFAGSTIPYYFLSLNGTRDVAGFAFHRKQSDRLSLFAGASYLEIPTTFTIPIQRRKYAMQNAGASYRLGKNFLVSALGGYSNAGNMARADASYTSFRFSGYGSAMWASQTFPLNQLQSLFSGTSAMKTGLTYRTTSRLSQGLSYERTQIVPGLIYRYSGSSEYLSPFFGYKLTRDETLNFAYTYSRNTGGFSPTTTTGNRYDVSLNSVFKQHISNTAQATIGSFQDPLQVNSEDQLTLRDSISFPIKGQTVLLGVQHDQAQPSLIGKLNQELGLLSPLLQAQFLANPQAFIDSSNFPPEVKALLAAEQPTGTIFSGAAIIALGPKIRFSPNVSVTHNTNGTQADNWTQAFGYSFSYQIRPTFQFHSSLNNVLLFDSRTNNVVRTTVLSVGFQKGYAAAPGGLPFLHRNRMIEGRVFRDSNINGAYNIGEAGIPGIEVRLDDGQVAVTDEQGRYKFNSVSPDQHEVSIALTQFRNPVRMTTRGEAEVDLIQQHIVVANFGILDFARLMGNVYNDLRFENRRQPDSRGMQDLELQLDDGKEVRKIQTGGAGDFEVDNLPPGDYKLSLDPASIPANYVATGDTFTVHVSPVSTVVQDIPLRALRSISGQVLLKMKSNIDSVPLSRGKKASSTPASEEDPKQDFKLVPISGVEITAGPATATTDNEGKFLLRNLPAGELNVAVRPVKDAPSDIKIPSGKVKLPPEPVQIQGATIVITNEELLPYLTRDVPGAPRRSAEPSVAAGKPARATPAVVPAPAPVNAVENAKAANPAQPPASTLPTVEPPVPGATAQPVEGGTIIDGNLTRAICQQLPSLGEIAHCLQQLKQSRTTGPQK